MPFIPHTETEITAMLNCIGVASIEDLFDEIPQQLRSAKLQAIPKGLSECAMLQLFKARAKQITNLLGFIGAGAYEHHIPAAVWNIATRGEFLTAYTPYQAEASQGTLQVLYEYQTMIASLLGLDVANASLYDGASALAEACLLAVRAHKTSRRVLVAGTLHPQYRKVMASIVKNQQIELIELAYCSQRGKLIDESLEQYATTDIAAVIIPQPNFFGCLEDVDLLTDWAHARQSLVIASVNPIAMALLKEPGQWGAAGADIACGEGQSLGVPLASGGPYFGFLCCKKNLVRQMPGRIVGRTTDTQGRSGFTLTLQAREQHIRRSKAKSNICTNQGLLVTAATIYMSLLGPQGLRQVALQCHANTNLFLEKITALPGIKRKFTTTFFHEVVLQFTRPIAEVLALLADHGIQGGYALGSEFPELTDCLLVCLTETKTAADIAAYCAALAALKG